ncbi:NAD(P)H-hydrate dehydratase [Anaerosalibacter sp. Marseille-P3206]|uniref:NAD(P)H-hydrate dehydratase n=1 Tax=Anaerosalibacter sp. Marseille-P3206 TaxID=1871005 RepID=UPI0009854E30|nr:NAD(P)H-hydrate dehydratase [Anaerosalibacter sp. Marseille-P3206]
MIGSIGIDIVKINRIERIMDKNGERFLNKVFTTDEIEYIKNKKENIATISGIFASKEAVSKLLGTGIGKVSWKDIEVYHDFFGKPLIILHGNAYIRMKEKLIQNIHLTISHEREYAIAFAVGQGDSSSFLDKELINNTMKDIKYMSEILPKREKNSHKGSFGRVGIIAGSMGMTGAPYLSSEAALRTGSGLVYTISPKSLQNILSIKLTEAIIVPIEDHGRGHFVLDSVDDILEEIEALDLDVIAIGPGLGVDGERRIIVEELLKSIEKPVVLDADGLNCISNKTGILESRREKTVITPHPGELSRLLNISIVDIQNDRIKFAKMASEKYNSITILKGANTIVSSENGEIYINQTGNPGMATAGSGDVLTGVIASFLGQGIDAMKASILGVYCHGLAGDLASIDIGEYGLIARDILKYIPKSINTIQKF